VIDFKQFLTTIAAIFLALAVGVALGAGPLKSTADQQLRASVDQLAREKDDLRTQVLKQQSEQKYSDQAVTNMSPMMVAGKLTGRKVLMVTLPGADNADVDAVSRLVQQAGATVTGTVAVQRKYADPAQAQFVQELADSALASAPSTGLEIPASASGYQRVGYVLAHALVSKSNEPSDASSAAILTAFTDQGLIKAPDGLERGGAAVVVAGPPAPGGTSTEDPKAYAGLAVGLDGTSAGAVVAGPPDSARSGGAVNAIRTDDTARRRVSTVDQVQLPVGRLVVIYALVEQIAGRTGHYGDVGKTDGAAPKPAG
jgi:Copper transport outer membrane protein, MctB